MNVFQPLNNVGKSSFFNVAELLDMSLDCDKFTLYHIKTTRLVPVKKDKHTFSLAMLVFLYDVLSRMKI